MPLAMGQGHSQNESYILQKLLNKQEKALGVEEKFVKWHIRPGVGAIALKIVSQPSCKDEQAMEELDHVLDRPRFRRTNLGLIHPEKKPQMSKGEFQMPIGCPIQVPVVRVTHRIPLSVCTPARCWPLRKSLQGAGGSWNSFKSIETSRSVGLLKNRLHTLIRSEAFCIEAIRHRGN